jgi:hypothetical protein
MVLVLRALSLRVMHCRAAVLPPDRPLGRAACGGVPGSGAGGGGGGDLGERAPGDWVAL